MKFLYLLMAAFFGVLALFLGYSAIAILVVDYDTIREPVVPQWPTFIALMFLACVFLVGFVASLAWAFGRR